MVCKRVVIEACTFAAGTRPVLIDGGWHNEVAGQYVAFAYLSGRVRKYVVKS